MLTLAALALLGFGAPAKSPVQLFQERVGAWTIDYQRDRFADRLDCALYTGRRTRGAPGFEAGWLVFHFAKSEDTGQSVYRVDGGAPRSAAGGFLHRPSRYAEIGTLESATGGLVFIPAADVARAHTIEIRPHLSARVRRFDVGGLAEALDKARAQGCRL